MKKVIFLLLLLLNQTAVLASAKEPPKKPVAKETPAAKESPDKPFAGLGFTSSPSDDGTGRTSLFGIAAEANKIVYVIDRSGSMGGRGREALGIAKAELIRSFNRLDKVHQFQIVFYNERPIVFNPTGTPGRLAFATDANKRRAVRFLDTIVSDGGTAHEDALRLAIWLRPDVIFLLTDADDPKLSNAQLAKIRQLAAGIIINAVEFGSGPKPNGKNFLAALASQNGGKHVYIDIAKRKLAAPRPKSK